MTRLVLLLLATSCTRIEHTVRTERGPLLRSFTREQVLQGTLRGDARVSWPKLELMVTEEDVCRTLSLDEYAEERITERSAPAAGAALSTGIAGTLGAAVLLGISFALSNSPDMTTIDTTGRYGPAPRTVMQGASVVTVAVGLPALIVGAIGWLRTGEDVEQRKAEQETGQRDVACHGRPVTGVLRLMGARGELGTIGLSGGVATIEASVFESLRLGDREVVLDEASALTVGAFGACVTLEAEGALAPESLSDSALLARVERSRACRQVRPEVAVAPLQALEAELGRRRASGAPAAFAPGPNVGSFEDAFAAYAPRLSFKPGSTDLAKLDSPEALNGQAVLVLGVVSSALAENIGVLQVGERELFVFIPPKRAWGGDFPNGSRVEAVAVMAGWQTVGDKTLPLARLVWMRPGF